MAETFPWASQRFVSYNPTGNLNTSFREERDAPIIDRNFGFSFLYNNTPHYFIPESVINKGFTQDGYQFYLPGILQPGAISAIQQSPLVNVKELSSGSQGYKFEKDYKKSNFEDQSGYLIPAPLYEQFKNPGSSSELEAYKIGTVGPEGVKSTEIQGIGNKNGQPVYVVGASGRENAASYIYFDPQQENKSGVLWQEWYEPPPSWVKPAMIVGGLLIGGGLAGAFGPAAGASAGASAGATGGTAAATTTAGASAGAAGGTAAGTGLTIGAGGTTAAMAGTAGGTGLTIGSGAGTAAAVGGAGTAGVVAPAGFVFAPSVGTGVGAGVAAGAAGSGAAPISTATPVPAGELAYPGVEVAPSFTPAPDSLQAALPGLGVETAASAAPFTAVPGSFQAALPVLGIASAPSLAGNLAAASSGISATDALRIANQARGLLGAGQNPIIPQQQGLPQQAGGAQGVDYSGLLSLLQLQAKLPGVAQLTQPTQLRQMYQTTLLPDVLSLLG